MLKKFHRLFQHFPIKTFFINKISNAFHKRWILFKWLSKTSPLIIIVDLIDSKVKQRLYWRRWLHLGNDYKNSQLFKGIDIYFCSNSDVTSQIMYKGYIANAFGKKIQRNVIEEYGNTNNNTSLCNISLSLINSITSTN